jgi:hypothetical protein
MVNRGSFVEKVSTLLVEVSLVDRFMSSLESSGSISSKDLISKYSKFRTSIEAYSGIIIEENRNSLEESASQRLGDPYIAYLDEITSAGDVGLEHLKMLNIILTDVNLLVNNLEHLLLKAKDAEGDFREAADFFYDFYATFRDYLLSEMSLGNL